MSTDRAQSFGAIAETYDRFRPPSPPEALDWLLPSRRDVVVDLAAGTGILTRELVARVGRVIAVEPDDRMRAVLTARSPEIEAVAGTGEHIPLPDDSVDAVFVSSAWHWLDPDRAVPEIARVLHDGGRLGVVWTGRDTNADEPWWSDLARVVREAAHPADRGGRSGHHHVDLPPDAQFEHVDSDVITYAVLMAVDDIVALLGTYSGVFTLSESARDAGVAAARRWLSDHYADSDAIPVPMRSRLWRADRLAR